MKRQKTLIDKICPFITTSSQAIDLIKQFTLKKCQKSQINYTINYTVRRTVWNNVEQIDTSGRLYRYHFSAIRHEAGGWSRITRHLQRLKKLNPTNISAYRVRSLFLLVADEFTGKGGTLYQAIPFLCWFGWWMIYLGHYTFRIVRVSGFLPHRILSLLTACISFPVELPPW